MQLSLVCFVSPIIILKCKKYICIGSITHRVPNQNLEVANHENVIFFYFFFIYCTNVAKCERGTSQASSSTKHATVRNFFFCTPKLLLSEVVFNGEIVLPNRFKKRRSHKQIIWTFFEDGNFDVQEKLLTVHAYKGAKITFPSQTSFP